MSLIPKPGEVANRREYILVIGVGLQCFEVLVVGAEGQSLLKVLVGENLILKLTKKHFYLDVVLSGDLDCGGEGVPFLPEQVPSAQGVPVVGQLHVVGSGDVDHDDVAAG